MYKSRSTPTNVEQAGSWTTPLRLSPANHSHVSHEGAVWRPRSRHQRSLDCRTFCRRPRIPRVRHGQHHRRAPRHADGLSSSESARCPKTLFAESRIRQETIAAERHPARSWSHQYDVKRLAGHGPHRRGCDAHLANSTQDESARGPLAGDSSRTTINALSATSRITPSIRRSRTNIARVGSID